MVDLGSISKGRTAYAHVFYSHGSLHHACWSARSGVFHTPVRRFATLYLQVMSVF